MSESGERPTHARGADGYWQGEDSTSLVRLLLRPEEAAAVLAVGRSTVFELLRKGTIPSVQIGRARRISVDALRDFVGSLEGSR